MCRSTSRNRRPTDSAFHQQRLPAWQPVLTIWTVAPPIAVIGIIFIPIGITLAVVANRSNEVAIDYTTCTSEAGGTCADLAKSGQDCDCSVPFQLENDMNGPVYLYYALTNFYQNHRRYLTSLDQKQLRADPTSVDYKSPKNSSTCGSLYYVDKTNKEAGIYYPCGSVANSLFTDEITLLNSKTAVTVTKEGTAWDSDVLHRYEKPSWWSEAQGNPTHSAWKVFKKPKAWRRELWDWKQGVEDPEFAIWMRTSALPSFRKLYRVVPAGLPAGNYTFRIRYRFAVAEIHGTKSIIISTISALGSYNKFISIAYIVVGVICLVASVTLLLIYFKFDQRSFNTSLLCLKEIESDSEASSSLLTLNSQTVIKNSGTALGKTIPI